MGYLAVIAALFHTVRFPFQMAHYKIERFFQLSRQSLLGWLVDWIKGTALGAVLGAIAVTALYFFYVSGWPYWWAVAALALIAFSVLLAQLAPVLLIPLFYKMKPLDGSPLKDRLLDLCRRFQIPVDDVFHLGLGEKTEKGNAAFVGIGTTKRIILGDTLYERFSPDEIEAVFAHELGHQVHNDLWRGIIVSSVFILLGFGVANVVLAEGLPIVSDIEIDSGPRLFLFMVILAVVQTPFEWVQAVFSRWRERRADDFAATTIGVAGPLADALERLTIQNKGLFRPHPLIEFFSYSHPAPWRRISKLRHLG